MNVSKETVTPKKAMEWLKRNVNNRPLSTKSVTHYAKAMEAGAWRLNGDCIRFNGNGDLIDGQHRLNACVQAAKPFETYVIRGLEHDAFDTIDQGRKRKIGDVFSRQGYKHYSTLASAVRNMFRLETGWLTFRDMLRPDQANDLLEKHPALHAAVQDASEWRAHLVAPGLHAALLYLMRQSDEALANKFWSAVTSGENLTKAAPAYWLRERLIANTKNVAKLSQDVICALTIKAWNTFKSGKQCKNLKWDAEREDFPTID